MKLGLRGTLLRRDIILGVQRRRTYKLIVSTAIYIARRAVWVPSELFLVSDGGIACHMSLE